MEHRQNLDELLQESAKHIAQLVASSSFQFWERKDFRLYVAFQKRSQTEQDRMFNELEVSVLGLFLLNLDDGIANADDEKKIVLESLRKQIPSEFISMMRNAGVEDSFLDIWKALIDMRMKEYRKHVKIARKESKKWKELGDDENMRNVWSRIETITIDCLSHIQRGKVKEGDPLWKLLRKWLITLDATITPITSLGQEVQEKSN